MRKGIGFFQDPYDGHENKYGQENQDEERVLAYPADIFDVAVFPSGGWHEKLWKSNEGDRGAE